ncbi:TraB/GumN family protein [Reinekea thalattae]|nr:TraB/GumN family protein [Reinekea thalattae]
MRIFISLLLLIVSSISQAVSIWQVEGKQTFYIFGTVHMMKPSSYPLPEVYDHAFNQCDDLWLEVDTTETSDPSVVTAMQQLMLLPQNKTLSREVSAANYSRLQQLAEYAGSSLQPFEQVKPWMVANILSVAVMQQQGLQADLGLDSYLQNKAVQKGIPVHAFETSVWQLSMLDDAANLDINKYISFATQDIDQIDQYIEQLYRYWEIGNPDRLYKIAKLDTYPEIEQRILTQRNDKWFATLSQESASQTHCVAVGTLHLGGKNGLLDQFKAANYRVTQL